MASLNIIIPNIHTDFEYTAAKELSFFIKKICNMSSNIARECEPRALVTFPMVAIGQTEMFKKENSIAHLKDDLGEDGYKIIMTHEKVMLCGGGGQGTIFAVYRLLNEVFNLKIFTKDVFTFDKNELAFSDGVIVEKPDFPMRSVGINPVHIEERNPSIGDLTYCYRMRLQPMDHNWGIHNHSYFRILPPEVYKKDHPDWYAENGSQLCLSNEEMTRQFTENLKAIVEATPSDTYYMLGMEDSKHKCECEKCKALTQKYKGFDGALMLQFTNKVVNSINSWLKENYPERKVKFYTFAYMWSELPPVIKDKNKNYHLVFDELKPADNLGVLIAPLRSNATYPMTDIRNIESLNSNYHKGDRVSVKDLFEGWRFVCKELGAWIYNLNFWDYLCPCPMWDGMDENFRWLKSIDTKYIFMEAGIGRVYGNFSTMKIYCASQLMWNTSLNLVDLIHEFMEVYYQNAHVDMFNYFTDIHKHAKWISEKYNRQMIFVQFDDEPNINFIDERFWPKNKLLKWLDIFDKALEKNLSQDVYDRVALESVNVRFTLLALYRNEIDKNLALKNIELTRSISKKSGVTIAWGRKPKNIFDNLDLWEKELTEDN